MRMKFYALWLCLIMIVIYVLQVLMDGFTSFFVLNESSWFEPWRFISAVFLHGGIGHLLSNMFALALFGTFLENYIGSRRFLNVFFVTGILANLVSINYYSSSLGASGAIFGVIGALIIVRPTMMIFAFGLPMPIFIAGILWVLVDIMGVFTLNNNVGNIAHLSGIGFGFVLGYNHIRTTGSHAILNKIDKERGKTTVPVPLHKELAKGTLKSIMRQTDLTREKLFELL